jgi:ComF family protein
MFRGARASVNAVSGGLATIVQNFATHWLPPVCCLCACRGMPGPLDLCSICREMLPPNPSERDVPPPFCRAVVPYSYAYPVDHCVRALKFKGERVYARVFGTLLANARMNCDAPLPDVVVPVPLHPSRYRERGFNQAQEIARFVARRLGVRVDTRCLIRVARTREQSGLSLAERVSNVRDAFSANASVRGARLALVDDVLTTGNTAQAAARALLSAGADEIELWAIAHVALD